MQSQFKPKKIKVMPKNPNVQVIKNAKVRYHADRRMWVQLDDNNNEMRSFPNGVMTNVRFAIGEQYVGCGSTQVGYAIGNLTANKVGRTPAGMKSRNLKLENNEFKSADGKVLKKVNRLFLYSDRKSVYIVPANS